LNETSDSPSPRLGFWPRMIIQGVFLLLLAVGLFFVVRHLAAMKPRLGRAVPQPTAPVVRTVTVRPGERRLTIHAEGTARPAAEVQISPQVSGKAVYVNPSLTPGGYVSAGELLVKIEPVDYELAVTLAEARVADAESKLAMAREEANVAVKEWGEHFAQGREDVPEPPPLVAKKPQLEAAEANLKAQKANLEKARLNLSRTAITAPFDAVITDKKVGVGQTLAVGQAICTMHARNTMEIVLPLDSGQVGWVRVPGLTVPAGEEGAGAVVRVRAGDRTEVYDGKVVRAQGKVDPATRLVDVVVRVENPYAKTPPLTPGMFASVDLEGEALQNVAAVPRLALRQGGILWVAKDGKLSFRKVEVALLEGNDAIVSGGLEPGDQVVVSDLKEVTDGMTVRVANGEQAE